MQLYAEIVCGHFWLQPIVLNINFIQPCVEKGMQFTWQSSRKNIGLEIVKLHYYLFTIHFTSFLTHFLNPFVCSPFTLQSVLAINDIFL